MNPDIERKLYIFDRIITKIVTDFNIVKLLKNKVELKGLRRYKHIIRDIEDHYAYSLFLSIGMIFDKRQDVNKLKSLIELLPKMAKNNLQLRYNKVENDLRFVIKDRRHVLVAHSSKSIDNDSNIFYKTYSLKEFRKISLGIKNIEKLFHDLSVKLGRNSDFDHNFHSRIQEMKYLVNNLIDYEIILPKFNVMKYKLK